FRGDEKSLPVEAFALDGDVGRRVFLAARQVLPRRASKPARLGATMQQLLEVANRRAPSIGSAWLPVLGWLGSLVVALVAIVGVTRPPMRWIDWKAEDGTFSVSLPGLPQPDAVAGGGPTVVSANAGKSLSVSVARVAASPVPAPPAGEEPAVLFHGEPATDRTF